MQKLKFVTCSGANEFTDIKEMVALTEVYPVIEWGIQVSGKKCSFGSARYQWLCDLQKHLEEEGKLLNLALHINQDWVEGFTTGKIPQELEDLLEMRDVVDEPLFQRLQLNFKLGRDKTPDIDLLEARLNKYGKECRFIFSYNPENKDLIHQIYREGSRDFDVLYDSSHGEGLLSQSWEEPAFYDESILQGYSGGISPENVEDVLSKIAEVVPKNRVFYIDAEGNLKGEDGHISLEKCAAYVKKTLAWEEQNEAQE